MNNRIERFSPAARRTLSLSQEAAETFRHSRIGTEHILLALSQDPSSGAGAILHELGLTPERLSPLTQRLSPAPALAAQPELGEDTKRLLEQSVDQARRRGDQTIGPEHLLLGLLGVDDCTGQAVLREAGADLGVLRQMTLNHLREQRQDAPAGVQMALDLEAVLGEMVAGLRAGRLTPTQAGEVLTALQPVLFHDMTDEQRLAVANALRHPSTLAGRTLRLTVSSDVAETTVDIPLADVLAAADAMRLAALTSTAHEAEVISGAIKVRFRLEKTAS